jgi:hypothetical protein
MNLYSDYPGARTRQIIADVIGVVSVAVVISIAVLIVTAIRTLAAFGRDLEKAGIDFQSGLLGAADALGDVPLIGDGIREPFDAAASAGESVAEAGRGQQQLVEFVALAAGWSFALLPLLVIALVWLVPRWRFVRRSGRMRAMIAQGMTVDTLAARALARAPLAHLVSVHPDPAAAWRSQDPDALRDLAAIELRRAGVRPSSSTGSTAAQQAR